MGKIKVCHITSVHTRYDTRILMKECVSLAKEGYKTYLIVNDSLDDEKYKGVFIKTTGFVAANRINRMLQGTKAVYSKAIKINADIYHIHDPELLFIGEKLKKKGKIVIFDSHENYELQIMIKEYIPVIFRMVIRFIYKKFETRILKKLDGVIIPCTFDKKKPFEGINSNVEIIGNLPIIDMNISEISEKNFHERKICCTGSLTYTRGIKHLVKIADKASCQLILAGIFSPKEFENELKKMKEYRCVKYAGKVSQEEAATLQKDSSIGMSLCILGGQYGKSDTLPTKVYEYMLAGLPVIIQKDDFTNEMLEKYQFGIGVDTINPKEVVTVINNMFEHPEKMREYGMNGRKVVLESLNWTEEEKKLCRFYRKLIESER